MTKRKKQTWIVLGLIMVLQFIAASYFCMQKQGYHYDEYYSYYSSNVTYGLVPTDREWKPTKEIKSEFMALPGEGFRYDVVKLMQTFDVHPPLYYYILHTVCSLFPGVFSKWIGLSVNLICFLLSFVLLYCIGNACKKEASLGFGACLLFGFQPGVISGITFIRMYMLLTVWCFLLVLWHLKAMEAKKWVGTWQCISLFVLVFLGFMTHYYFAVFLFFVAAFTCLTVWLIEKRFFTALWYGLTVILGMITGVLYYPACVSHIFRGYRGPEAIAEFGSVSNTGMRIGFFGELLNRFTFGGSLYLILLLILVLALTCIFFQKTKTAIPSNFRDHWENYKKLYFLLFICAGYFLIVAKTALLNAEEANRYELPVYGLIPLVVLWILDTFWEKILAYFPLREGKVRIQEMGLWATTAIIVICQLFALSKGEVQFLYPKDKDQVAFAKEHQDSTVLYLYSPNNQWMIWDEAEELMQYQEIYFVNLADTSPIQDQKLLAAKEIYVYASRMDEAMTVMEELEKENPALSELQKVRELLYCDLYVLK